MGLDMGTRNDLLSVRTDLTPTRYSKSVNVGERGTTVNWRSILATKIRLENGNDNNRMEKKKTMTAVRRGSYCAGNKKRGQ